MRAAGPFLYSFIALFEAGTNPLLDNKHYTTNHKFRVDAGLKSVWRRDHIFNFLTRYKRAGNRNSAGISGRRCARRRRTPGPTGAGGYKPRLPFPFSRRGSSRPAKDSSTGTPSGKRAQGTGGKSRPLRERVHVPLEVVPQNRAKALKIKKKI